MAILLNYEYFLCRFPKHLAYFVISLVLIGLFINPDFISNRYLGIFWNENAFASFTCMSFAVFFLQDEKRTNLDNFLMTLLIIISVSTGFTKCSNCFNFMFFAKIWFVQLGIVCIQLFSLYFIYS